MFKNCNVTFLHYLVDCNIYDLILPVSHFNMDESTHLVFYLLEYALLFLLRPPIFHPILLFFILHK